MINARQLTRRGTLLLGVAGLASSFPRNVEAAHVEAAQESERHGMSAFGDLKYPPDFQHFDYVNPKAPKGGSGTTKTHPRAFFGKMDAGLPQETRPRMESRPRF